MTIVVIKDGYMVGDTLYTAGDNRAGNAPKIYDVGTHIVGLAGYHIAMTSFVTWFKEGRPEEKRPSLDKEYNGFSALLYNKKTKEITYMDESFVETKTHADFYAIGSGSDIAKGAMLMGASAVEAVKAAIKLNTTCGAPLQKVKLK